MKLAPIAASSCLVLVLTSTMVPHAGAVPYASGIHNNGGMVEFVLNEPADKVTITRDGGNPLVIDNAAAGRHQFDLEGFSSYEIAVAKSAAASWTTIHGAGNPFSNFTLPTGLAINTNPASPYFGTIYVAHPNTTATVAGRAMGDGIYSLTADMMGVDLANNFTKVDDPNDTSQAKAPGFVVNTSTSSSPWRLSLDAGGNVIVADWSDSAGGIKWASPDLTMGGRVLGGREADGVTVAVEGDTADNSGTGRTGGVYATEQDEFGPIPLHGSIASKVYTTGTVGVDLTVWAMDEDLDVDLATPPNANDGNSIWRWDVGSATDFDAMAPELVIAADAIPRTSDNRRNFLTFNTGVSAGAHYEPEFNKWYLVEPRSAGNEACIIVVTPDGTDGFSPVLNWSSLQFSIDNNLDPDATAAGIQDIFRRTRDVTVSPDGKYLVVNRSEASAAAGGLGTGAVVLIPLDENGIPDITVEGGVMTNVETLQLVNNNLGHNTGAQLEFDAAGNLYVAHSGLTTGDAGLTAQLIQVFSPGGNTLATTRSDGTFDIDELVIEILAGDYNNDGSVDAADYVVWRNNLGLSTVLPNDDTPGVVDISDYLKWRDSYVAFNQAAGALALQSVPEPQSLLLGAIVVGLAGWRIRRRRAE